MKKVLFSAIMMIAFSGVSLANNIAEKEVIIEDSKEVVENLKESFSLESASKVVLAENCLLTQLRTYNLAIELGYSTVKAKEYSYIAYCGCVSKNLQEMNNSLIQK